MFFVTTLIQQGNKIWLQTAKYTLPERIDIHHDILRFRDSLLGNVLQTEHGHGNRRPTVIKRKTANYLHVHWGELQTCYMGHVTIFRVSPSSLGSLHGRDFSVCYLHHQRRNWKYKYIGIYPNQWVWTDIKTVPGLLDHTRVSSGRVWSQYLTWSIVSWDAWLHYLCGHLQN